jgi:hypothetical protein
MNITSVPANYKYLNGKVQPFTRVRAHVWVGGLSGLLKCSAVCRIGVKDGRRI